MLNGGEGLTSNVKKALLLNAKRGEGLSSQPGPHKQQEHFGGDKIFLITWPHINDFESFEDVCDWISAVTLRDITFKRDAYDTWLQLYHQNITK